MSKWSDTDESRIYRALVVQEFGDADALEYLAGQSRADDGRRPDRRVATDGGRPDASTDEIRIYGTADDGRPLVERKTVRDTHSTTEATYRKLPPELAVLVDGARTSLSDLSPTERQWVRAETEGDVPDPNAETVSIRDADAGTVTTAETTARAEQAVMTQWRGGQ